MTLTTVLDVVLVGTVRRLGPVGVRTTLLTVRDETDRYGRCPGGWGIDGKTKTESYTHGTRTDVNSETVSTHRPIHSPPHTLHTVVLCRPAVTLKTTGKKMTVGTLLGTRGARTSVLRKLGIRVVTENRKSRYHWRLD